MALSQKFDFSSVWWFLEKIVPRRNLLIEGRAQEESPRRETLLGEVSWEKDAPRRILLGGPSWEGMERAGA